MTAEKELSILQQVVNLAARILERDGIRPLVGLAYTQTEAEAIQAASMGYPLEAARLLRNVALPPFGTGRVSRFPIKENEL